MYNVTIVFAVGCACDIIRGQNNLRGSHSKSLAGSQSQEKPLPEPACAGAAAPVELIRWKTIKK